MNIITTADLKTLEALLYDLEMTHGEEMSNDRYAALKATQETVTALILQGSPRK